VRSLWEKTSCRAVESMITLKDEHGRRWSIVRADTVGLIEHLSHGGCSAFTNYGYNLVLKESQKNLLMKWLEEQKNE